RVFLVIRRHPDIGDGRKLVVCINIPSGFVSLITPTHRSSSRYSGRNSSFLQRHWFNTPRCSKTKECGMSFPKRGKFFPGRNGYDDVGGSEDALCFTAEIASALRRSLGTTGAGVKTVAGWTGANEKTVKNWFSGRYGP